MSVSTTIVVPIQVVVVRPSYKTTYNIDPVMQQFRQAFQNVLWDDMWTATGTRVSHPGGLLASAQRKWTHRTVPSWTQYKDRIPFPWSGSTDWNTVEPSFHDVTNGAGIRIGKFTRPDDIWIQCGVQFRLIKVVELSLSRDFVELRTGDEYDDLICDKTGVGLKFDAIVKKASEPPYALRYDLPVVVFNWTVQPLACSLPTQRVDLACDGIAGGFACGGGGWVGVGIQNIDDLNAAQATLALSHELGHVLGLPDLNCTGGGNEGASLMCGFITAASPIIKPGTCDKPRSQATTLRRRYIGY
jgi:hypothetical protein